MSNSTPPTTAAADKRPFRYTGALANDIEQRWQERWEREQAFRAPNPSDPGFDGDQAKFFCMDMFPYPSGAGLHVGHPLGYIASDIVSRYMRHRNCNVLHPMGWDAFGLPAEQYALQTGVHPAVTTRKAIDTFRRQLTRFGFSYDWSREFATIDEDYYRWTQWIWRKAYLAWFDRQQKRARPINELVQELENGRWFVDPSGDITPGGTGGSIEVLSGEPVGMRKWHELTNEERRELLDNQRLAYLAEQTVNWCPKLGTALANEEVIDGRSERGGYPVFRKPLRQWMFRITAYAERLLEDLEGLDWPDSTRTMQQEWIGRSEGAEIDFPLGDESSFDITFLRVFTTRPDTLFGATFMVIAPEHPLVDEVFARNGDVDALRTYVEDARNRSEIDRMADTKTKTGVPLGVDAINPGTGGRIPIFVADYVLMGYGHGAIMAVPAHDERDYDFAKAYNLQIAPVVKPERGEHDFSTSAFAGVGIAINSENDETVLNDLPTAEAKERIIHWLQRTDRGNKKIIYKLRDWLFSRQRYWGEPFPIVYDEAGNHYTVTESHLPVQLPQMADYQPIESDEPQPLLAKATEWVHTTAGAAGVDPSELAPETPVRRETNTMPGWAGSCWYELRYADPRNEERFVGRDAERYWMLGPGNDARHGGVDLYIGGAEHAVLHLLYARFWHKMLFDLNEVSTPEPFQRLFHQGMIQAFAYQRADGSLVAVDDVEQRGDALVESATGDSVTQVVAKMSKSLRNVVNPDDVIAEYGADTFRLYEMYMGPLDASKPWNTQDIVGLFRFLQRIWRLVINEDTGALQLAASQDQTIEKQLHRTIAKVGDDIERLSFNTAIAALIELVNEANKRGGLTRGQLERFAIVLEPFAPHMAEELWSKLGHGELIAKQPWPRVDESMLADDVIELPVQIAGKVRSRITVPADAEAKAIEAAALADARVQEALSGKPPRKVIVVPGKIVNVIP